jgi:ferritin-like metal-binding protein YciE
MSVTKEAKSDSLETGFADGCLHDLFLKELAEMYDAEKKLALALPIVAKAAHGEDLKKLVEVHLKETQGHADTIRHVAESLEKELPDVNCKAMKRLINEAVKALAKHLISPVRDIALIAAAQKIEHYEIAAYGTLCAWAKQLGYTSEFALLFSTLQQEKTADELLTGVARGSEPLAELIRKHVLEKVAEDVPT